VGQALALRILRAEGEDSGAVRKKVTWFDGALAQCYNRTKLLRFGKNAPYEGETFPFLPCLNSLQRAGIAPGAAL
jgi:hypothetical protein